MFDAFKQMALSPMLLAAVIAAILGSVAAEATTLDDPFLCMLLSAAGAVGGVSGAAALKRRV